jgi:hypothetical protein
MPLNTSFHPVPTKRMPHRSVSLNVADIDFGITPETAQPERFQAVTAPTSRLPGQAAPRFSNVKTKETT